MGLFLNTRALNVGDALVKRIRRGLVVRRLIPGSIHLSSELINSDRINYNIDGADIKATWNLWEMESGELGTIDSIRAEMQAKLTDFYVNKAFTALSTIWSATNTPNNFTNVGGTLTAASLKNAIDTINQQVGRANAIVGTRKALTPITTFGGGWDSVTQAGTTQQGNYPAIAEIWQTGWLGVYYGVPIVALDQIYDYPDSHTALIPEDKVLVLSKNAGEFITYGPVKEKAYDNMSPTPPQFCLELYQQFGLIVDNAQGIFVLKVA